MQLIPSLVLQHLSNPAHIEELFVKYIEKAGLRIDSSKTISGVAYFHKQKFPAGATSLKYFSGTYDSQLTNMPGNSFIRPQSEHTLIWAVRLESVNGALSPLDLIWVPGVNSDNFLNNLLMTITTNSEVKIKNFPVTEALSDMTVRTDGLIPIAEPIFWAGQQDFVVEMANGEGAAAAGDENLKVTLIGLGLI